MAHSALVVYLVFAMKAWVNPGDHAYYEPPSTTEARYQAIAEDIATVAMDPEERPVLPGPSGRAMSALLLASIASFEGSFHAGVDSCAVAGGSRQVRAWSSWQIQGDRASLCVSRIAAAHAALRIVRRSFEVCSFLSVKDRLSWYTDGSCHRDWVRSSYRVGRATSWAASHGIPFDPFGEI